MLWKNVLAGNVSASFQEFSRLSLKLPVYQAPTPSFSKKEFARLRRADRSSQLALAAAREAWKNAGLESSAISPERVGVIIGSARGPVSLQREKLLERPSRPSDSLYSSFSSTAGIVSNVFQSEGPALMVSSSCTSGATALKLAAQMIRSGELDVVVVGGAEAPLQESILEQYQATGILAQSPIPSKALAPFDQYRSGTVLGEGAAFLILESESFAMSRRAQMLGRLESVSIGTQSRYRAGLDREGLSLEKILHCSLQEAKRAPQDISLLHLHGTGTVLNDLLESQAVTSVFGKISEQPYACATKDITGHTLGAASLFQVLLTLCALRENTIPKTTNCVKLDPACSLRLATTANVPQLLSTGLCLTSGFWGNVASVIVSAA